MPIYVTGVIIVVVLVVSRISSTRLRAVTYSLPIPMTLVLISSANKDVSGLHLLGVVDLVFFFFVISAITKYTRLVPLARVVLAVISYIAVATVLAYYVPHPHFPATATCVVGAWLIFSIMLACRFGALTSEPGDDAELETHTRWDWTVRIATVTAATFAMVGLASLVKGLAVTFPYSGTLVAFSLGRSANRFAIHFTVQSIALIAFISGYFGAQQAGTDVALRIGTGWAAFAVAATAVQLTRAMLRGSGERTTSSTG
jgi:hypothetical protein